MAAAPRSALAARDARPGTPEQPASTPAKIYQKTKMCKFYEVGKCKRGARCFYAHSHEELQDMPDLAYTRICPTVHAGKKCMNNACTYAHKRTELRAPVAAAQPKTAAKAAKKKNRTAARTDAKVPGLADSTDGAMLETTQHGAVTSPTRTKQPSDCAKGKHMSDPATNVLFALFPSGWSPANEQGSGGPVSANTQPGKANMCVSNMTPMPWGTWLSSAGSAGGSMGDLDEKDFEGLECPAGPISASTQPGIARRCVSNLTPMQAYPSVLDTQQRFTNTWLSNASSASLSVGDLDEKDIEGSEGPAGPATYDAYNAYFSPTIPGSISSGECQESTAYTDIDNVSSDAEENQSGDSQEVMYEVEWTVKNTFLELTPQRHLVDAGLRRSRSGFF